MERSGKPIARHICLFIISFFGTGLISKKMPGTVGSIFASVISLLIFHFSPNYLNVFLILSVLTFIIGSALCDIFIIRKKYESNRDPGYAVIDEACGIFLGLYILGLFSSLSYISILINFLLFRIFDIWKPFPIRTIEKAMKRSDNTVGIGIMFDDVLAAVFATALQIVVSKLF